MVCWRKVLKRQWETILGVLFPELLAATLCFLPEDISRTLQDPEKQCGETRAKHSKMLLETLVRWDIRGWPDAFIKDLKETDQAPLANALEQDYKLVVQMERDRRDKHQKRGFAPRAVHKMKHTVVSLFIMKHAAGMCRRPILKYYEYFLNLKILRLCYPGKVIMPTNFDPVKEFERKNQKHLS